MSTGFRKLANAAAAMAVSLSRPNYFESGKKGELAELRQDLVSNIPLLVKEAMKKVIAGMTIGKDVSPLFAEVLKCIATDDLELKKLVYLYLMNYAKTQPELALLAINTFIKDSEDVNPVVRALAIRTMGCIRIERILDYLVEPIRRGVKDTSPYVRKTAALCIAKVFELSPEMGEDCGFLELLQELLMNDSNPMVISNVIAALCDIQALCPALEALQLGEQVVRRLLAILSDCTEWGQVFILDALAAYSTGVLEEAERVVEAVLPRLQHANQAVVMSAVGVLLQHGLLGTALPANHHFRTVLERKLPSPLISLLSAPPNPPELQYVALRNVTLLLRHLPRLLGDNMQVLLCNYNDPQYVKLEKLEAIGLLLVDDRCIDRLLPELQEYAKDVDGHFAQKAIRIMAQCALNAPRWSPRMAQVFAELLLTDRPEIVQQITVSLVQLLQRDECAAPFVGLLRERYFADLAGAHDVVQSEAEALAAFVWLLGAFLNGPALGLAPEDIERGAGVFSALLERFALEPLAVQEQIVLAALKIFLLNREQGALGAQLRERAAATLALGVAHGEAVELQDRCRMYAVLLEGEPGRASASPPPPLPPAALDPFRAAGSGDDEPGGGATPLERLLLGGGGGEKTDGRGARSLPPLPPLGSVASVLHLAPGEFVSARQVAESLARDAPHAALPDALARLVRDERPAVTNLLGLPPAAPAPPPAAPPPAAKYASLLDLLD